MVVPEMAHHPGDARAGRRAFCDSLRESLAAAERLHLTLTVENLGFMADLYGRSEHLLEMCAAVGPQLMVTFDAGNFLLAGEDTQSALQRLFPKVAQVHFKDWKAVPAGTPCSYPGVDGCHYQGAALGEGEVDLSAVLRRLQALGYSGTIAVEYEGPDDPLAAVGRGLAHLRKLGIGDG
jgi:sugar phosphate isomerase/epimerase